VDWVDISADERVQESVACNAGSPARLDHPINCVTWHEAAAYCSENGKRLPTEEEWEWAARGQSAGQPYAWGSAAPDTQLCWSGKLSRLGTCAVGTFPSGDAPGGIHDLAGNVWEWTASEMDPGRRVYRGGAWNSKNPSVVRSSYRGMDPDAVRSASIGFRCAKSR
jgi:formylglycine-generating enzyme required for sulfatase activity